MNTSRRCLQNWSCSCTALGTKGLATNAFTTEANRIISCNSRYEHTVQLQWLWTRIQSHFCSTSLAADSAVLSRQHSFLWPPMAQNCPRGFNRGWKERFLVVTFSYRLRHRFKSLIVCYLSQLSLAVSTDIGLGSVAHMYVNDIWPLPATSEEQRFPHIYDAKLVRHTWMS